MRNNVRKMDRDFQQSIEEIHGKPVITDVTIISLSLSALIDLGCTTYVPFPINTLLKVLAIEVLMCVST